MKKITKILIPFICLTIVLISFSIIFFVGSDENKTIIILHAGGGYNNSTYLNAQETFEIYYNDGYRYFEYDLKLSSDGRIIGSHAWEHLDVENVYSLTYDEFCNLRLDNNMTPVNEEWLINIIKAHPEIKIVVDSKMDTTEQDALVLQRLEELESVYNIDISSNIIPEVFSIEMWDLIKDTTSFDNYFFSHYKVYYSVDYILENFSDKRFLGIALSVNCDTYFRKNLYRFTNAGKKIFMWDVKTEDDLNTATSLGANGIYVDNIFFK